MVAVSQIANRLLSQQLPDGDIAGLMLELSDITIPVSMQTAPSDATARAILPKGNWAKAATIAKNGCDPAVAALLAKKTSLQVRRAVCETTSDQDVLRELHAWASSKSDAEAMDTLVERLDAEWLLDTVVASTTKYSPSQLTTIAVRAVREVTDAYVQFSMCQPRVALHLFKGTVTAAACGEISGWNLERVLALAPTDRETLLETVARTFNGIVDMALLDVFASTDSSWQQLHGYRFPRSAGFASDAARRLIAAHRQWAPDVAERKLNSDLFDELIELGDVETSFNLLFYHAADMSKQQVQRLLYVATQAHAVDTQPRARGSVDISNHLFDAIDYTLDTEALLQYLRLGADKATWSWLTGKLPQKPRPGEITALLDNPGAAFGTTTQYTNRSFTAVPVDVATIARRVVDIRDFSEIEPWVDELVDALGASILSAASSSYNDEFQRYLAARLTNAFGNDAEAWRDALVQLSRSTVSIGRVIEAVKKLRAPRRTTPASATAISNDTVQLAFALDGPTS